MQKCGWCGRLIDEWDCPRWRRYGGQCFCSFACIAAGAYKGNLIILIGSFLVLGSMDILLGIHLLQNLTSMNFVMWLFPTAFITIFISHLTHIVITGWKLRKLQNSKAEV